MLLRRDSIDFLKIIFFCILLHLTGRMKSNVAPLFNFAPDMFDWYVWLLMLFLLLIVGLLGQDYSKIWEIEFSILDCF